MKLKKVDFLEDEFLENPPTEFVDENLFIDDSLSVDKQLIRMDINIIQFPIFSKNTKRKVNQVVRYFFNSNRDTYITVAPYQGDIIPGEAEEKIFIALMKIMKDRGMSKKFIVTATELKEVANIQNTAYISVIKKALSRLASTNYKFKNTMYSSEKKSILAEEIETTILSLRTLRLEEQKNKNLRNKIDDKRVKEVYEIEISDHFYRNIIAKGYLVYDSSTLLEISTSIARTIYMLVEKLRFNDLYLKLDVLYLIKRIPLKYDKKNISQTIKTLTKNLNELKDKKLIESFEIIKTSSWENSEIDIYFPEHSITEKQERFFEDYNQFKKMSTNLSLSFMENSENQDILSCEIEEVTEANVQEILDLMPSKAKKLKTMPKTIYDALQHYGYGKVKSTAVYMKKNKIEKIRAYFLKALENNWAEDITETFETLEISKNQIFEEIKSNETYNFDENLFNKFEKLDKEIQDGIESYSYRDYIEECGVETKIQQLAFAAARKSLICKFLKKYPKILEELDTDTIPKKEIVKEKILVEKVLVEEIKEIFIKDSKELKEKIELGIELNAIAYDISDEEKIEIKKRIAKEALGFITGEGLTSKILEEIINKNF
ncbi:hypothetical protein [Cetobacterium sp.]|uniref:hypothetical protein n=1 Tax=Cetobacterium sp. TaxID=2071632 RepID=UPI002FC62B29